MGYDKDFQVGEHKIYIYEDDSHNEFSGKFITEIWKKDGLTDSLHDKPAVIMASHDGRVLIQEWYHKDMLHRDAGPARIENYRYLPEERWSRKEEWYKNGVCTKLDGPAVQEICSDGLIAEERWMVNGQEHRIGGPSYISRDYETHTAIAEQWMQHGEFFRKEGPVYIERSALGKVVHEKYMDHDNNIAPEQHSL